LAHLAHCRAKPLSRQMTKILGRSWENVRVTQASLSLGLSWAMYNNAEFHFSHCTDVKGRANRMAGGRPLGVKLVAVFFLLDATALLLAAGIGYLFPGLQSTANNFIAQRAPYIKELELVRFAVFLAPLIACFRAVQGLG